MKWFGLVEAVREGGIWRDRLMPKIWNLPRGLLQRVRSSLIERLRAFLMATEEERRLEQAQRAEAEQQTLAEAPDMWDQKPQHQ